MKETGKELSPWEIPPDESYWQALLTEKTSLEQVPIDSEETPQKQDNATSPETTSNAQAIDQEPAVNGPDPSCWDIVTEHHRQGKTISLCVTGYNRGGLLVDWNGLVGFIPASQICDRLPQGDEGKRREALAARVGDTMTLEIIESDPAQNRLILSERASYRVQHPDYSLLQDIHPGDICQGTVTNLCSFGVFVDLGGVEGLIHISELSWGRVSHPADVLSPGEQVNVYILNVDPKHGRIGLSLKRLQPDPWEAVEERYQAGQIIEGTITSIVNFGVFIKIEEGLEGLIHISEFKDDGIWLNTRKEGQSVKVCILNIDSEQHRMGLGLAPVE